FKNKQQKASITSLLIPTTIPPQTPSMTITPSTPIAISPRRNPSPSLTDLTEVVSPNQPLTLPYNTPPPQTPNNDQFSSDITHILNHATDFYKQLWDFSPLPEDAPLH